MTEPRDGLTGRFLPGVSGNPNGRPKLPDGLKAAARSYARSAMAVLAQIMEDPGLPPTVRISAALGLLSRTGGVWDDDAFEIEGEFLNEGDLLRAVIQERAEALGIGWDEVLAADPDLEAAWLTVNPAGHPAPAED